MSHWGNVLKNARKRAKLTQEQLAAKVPISVSYIRKMETGLLGPPKREKAEDLAAVLSITDPKKRNKFFHAAGVGNDDDMEGFELVKVEDDEALKPKQQTSSTANPALSLSDSLLDTTFEQIEADVQSQYLSEEERERWAAGLIEANKLILKLIKLQPDK